MIKLTRVVVHCEQDDCTFESKEELSKLKEKVAAQLGISPAHIICNYSEIKTQQNESAN